MRRSLLSLLVLTACNAAQPTVTTPEPGAVATDLSPSSTVARTRPTTTTVAPVPSSTDLANAPERADTVGVLPEGFELTAATLTKPDGTGCDLCLWLAATSSQRTRGLMFVTDLGAADGMAFRYSQPRTTRFWMKNTVLPLSIAFYRADGLFMDSFDMDPCATGDCAKYSTPIGFTVAVETAQGELGPLGLVAGSTLTLLDVPCEN
jgi:uncharacterized membrane protein (UPF0127 family)